MRLLLFLLPLVALAQSHADFRAALLLHEGYSLTPYRVRGIPHVGIGHRILPGEHGPWTPARVEEAFTVDLAIAYEAAMTEIPTYHYHPPAIRIMLVEIAFQCGAHGLHKFKRFRAAMDRFDYVNAARELRRSKLARQTPGRVRDYLRVLAHFY